MGGLRDPTVRVAGDLNVVDTTWKMGPYIVYFIRLPLKIFKSLLAYDIPSRYFDYKCYRSRAILNIVSIGTRCKIPPFFRYLPTNVFVRLPLLTYASCYGDDYYATIYGSSTEKSLESFQNT